MDNVICTRQNINMHATSNMYNTTCVCRLTTRTTNKELNTARPPTHHSLPYRQCYQLLGVRLRIICLLTHSSTEPVEQRRSTSAATAAISLPMHQNNALRKTLEVGTILRSSTIDQGVCDHSCGCSIVGTEFWWLGATACSCPTFPRDRLSRCRR